MHLDSVDRSLASNQKKEEKPQKESSWSKLINGIIRPPRSNYRQAALGTRVFMLNEIRYERNDVTVRHGDQKLLMTVYEPQYKGMWIILYLHGNSSSRLEATGILKYLPYKFSLACFDFIGCGQNKEADTISLGYRQSQQAQTAVNFLGLAGYKVLIWGRSMGAATALKYGKSSVIVADSSFSSFKSLCRQVAQKNAPKCMPNCIISCFFPCVFHKLRADVQQKGGYDVECLDIKQSVQNISQQTLIIFISGDNDTLIDKINSQKLYNSFKGKHKHLQIFKGTHNTKRPEALIKKIMRTIGEFVQRGEGEKDVLSRTNIDHDVTNLA